MFKRVEKRRKKREEEIKLGIDDEARIILGLNDTDSDESESEPSDEVSSENESEEWGGIGGDDGVDREEESEEDDEEEEEEGLRHIAFEIFTAQQALDEPIYAHPTQDNVQLCAICPGKTLIHPQTISQHLASKAHERRSKHIANLASLPEHADSSLSDLMQLMGGEPRPGFQHPNGHADKGTSKRAEKKRKTVEIRKAMREKKKAREREKKENKKVEDARDDQKPAKAPTASPSAQSIAPSTKKDKFKDGIKTESAKTVQAKRPESSTKKAAEKGATAKPNDKKRKKGAEKEKDSATPTDSHAPAKKRKTDDEDILKVEVAQQIKDIAKSATVRARMAQSKAKQTNGEGKLKSGKGNKSS